MRYKFFAVLLAFQLFNTSGATRLNREAQLAHDLLPQIVQIHVNWADTIKRLVPNPTLHAFPIFRNSDVRDGLQSYTLNGKPLVVDPKIRAAQIEAAASYFTHFDALSMANVEQVPQMGGANTVLDLLSTDLQPRCQALVMHEKGFDEFLKLGLPHWNGTIGMSDDFNLKNTRKTFEQALGMYKGLINQWQKVPEADVFRGRRKQAPWCFLSNAFHDPYTLEPVDKEDVDTYIYELRQIGFEKVILSDTSGQARLHNVSQLLDYLRSLNVPFGDLGAHFHGDEAPGNAALAFAMGIPLIDLTTLDAGGCNALKDTCTADPTRPRSNLNNTRSSYFFALLKALGYTQIPSYEKLREFEKTSPLAVYINFMKVAPQFAVELEQSHHLTINNAQGEKH